MATHAAASQPEGPDCVGPDGRVGGRLAPQSAYPSSVAERALCRQTPEVGAVCGKAARTVLCGGRPVMGVPTAIGPPPAIPITTNLDFSNANVSGRRTRPSSAFQWYAGSGLLVIWRGSRH